MSQVRDEGGASAERLDGGFGNDHSIRALLERRQGRCAEELLDQIAAIVGSPRRYSGLYQKSLG